MACIFDIIDCRSELEKWKQVSERFLLGISDVNNALACIFAVSHPGLLLIY